MHLRSMILGLWLTVAPTAYAVAGDWSRFEAPGSQFVLDLPTGTFVATNGAKGGARLTLSETAGGAVIDVYGGTNVKRLEPREFIAELSRSPRIADTSYTASGKGWFVISGHYVREASDKQTLIYYAKFVFSRDLRRFAAFEISYPVMEKLRMDPVVKRMEETLQLVR